MSLISGNINEHGAIISVTIAVSGNRRAVLEKNSLPVPKAVSVRAQLDTGSFITGFTSAVFEQLGIGHIQVIRIRTPSTTPGQPCDCRLHDVVLSLVSGMDPTPFSVRVIASDEFDRERDGDVHGIIGRDILDRCNLNYFGPDKRFSLAC